jgi:hypothetical protein
VAAISGHALTLGNDDLDSSKPLSERPNIFQTKIALEIIILFTNIMTEF